jgi:hypothetical protein
MNGGNPANGEMERVAELLVSDLTKKGLSLDYSPESLVRIDQVLANYGHGKGNGDQNMGLVELIGAYFGQVVRRNIGGNWFENIPPDGATGLLVDEGTEMWLWCHSIVHKQLEQGNKDLFEIFSDVQKRLKDWRRN